MENDIGEELEALQSIYSPDEVDVVDQTRDNPSRVVLKVNKQAVVIFQPSCKYHDCIARLFTLPYPHKQDNFIL